MKISLKVENDEFIYISDKVKECKFIEIAKIFGFDEIIKLIEKFFVKKLDLEELSNFIDIKLDDILQQKVMKICENLKLKEIQIMTSHLYVKLPCSVRNLFKTQHINKTINKCIKTLDNYHQHSTSRSNIFHCLIKNCNKESIENISYLSDEKINKE